ncbi:SMC family ATPase [Rhodococcus triatomae]|uniref:Nuclease SbcCD subunit C n=1 Tax=Rhodococcus triatomae TaxID=300028 RepID=A0A1G7ZJQ0_9NOCA|nr:SMC family ATPase [Rhodococcus triatomae]QNG22305.1 SMC family ATPase [Rhodococcus triatomae]SDH08786.1 exonuclease SbcC [Rhodococcus triatomae]
MRLHALEITAFGPFADTVRVDFDALGADGLFLLHGQTGAGKTTVLDAVAFALYGTVPGARREGKRLLSDHAPTGSVPTVSLEATIGGRRLRVIRSPEYSRPKKRGTGSIVENAKATLTWLDGAGENLSRIPDIAEEVGRLVGMNADQFFQVVLLPQGEFARFLRADSDERGVLLERLFDTTRFGSVEDWFAQRRKDSARALDERLREIEVITAKVAATAGLEAGADADPLRWAEKLIDECGTARDAAAAALADAGAHARAADAALAEARRVHDLQTRRDRATAELERLARTSDDREAMAAEAAAARAAVPVAKAEADASRVRTRAQAARRRVEEVEAELSGVPGAGSLLGTLSWPPTEESRVRIRQTVRQWQDETVRLDAAVAEAEEADRIDHEILELSSRRGKLGVEADRVEDGLSRIPDTLEKARRHLEEAEKAAALLPGLHRDRDRAAEAARAVVEWRTRVAEADATSAVVEERRQGWNDAREHWLDLVQQRIDGMAAELAATLEEGSPCAVCGATEHPAPAGGDAAPVTADDENRARAREREAEAACTRAVDAAAAARRAVDQVAERGGDRDPETAREELESATAAYERAEEEAAAADSRANAVAAATAEHTRLTERRAAIAVEVAALSEQVDARRERVEAVRERLRGVAGDDPSVSARRARLERLAHLASTLGDARDDAHRHAEAAEEQSAQVRAAAAESGFESVEEALAAVREQERLEHVEHTLAAARDAEAAARAVLAEPDVRSLTDIPPVDLDAAVARQNEADSVEAAAIAAAAECDRRLADLERFVAQLRRALIAAEPVRATHEQLAALAEVIAGRGANTRKMSLRSYVLAARLEEVAASASVRLRRMSGGRYEFVHSDEAGARGKRGGLGLDIRDDFTGAVRSAKTLSGGESFLASLALALGLADVVAAESGGVVLDTMFIDEGFGTLDADTLDSVMGVLDELRDGGRVVGIVSHVDEMRQRIPSRLHVVRGRGGSHLEMIAG